MKKITSRVGFLMLMALGMSAGAQTIFTENFNATAPPALPVGWTQYNGDGLTVASNLSTYNFGANAWVSSSAAWSNGNNFVTSTSWYTPVGTSNDWLITPAITIPAMGYSLVWKAKAPDQTFADGYKVKVSNTNNTYTSFTTDLYTNTGEVGTWKTRALDLSAYAGQTIYLAFVNTSNDKYLLGIDDVEVKVLPNAELELSAISPAAYSPASYGVGGASVTLGGTVTNNGGATVTSFTVKYDAGAGIVSDTKTGLNIAPFASYNFTHNTAYTIPNPGAFPVDMWIELSGDADLTNDTLPTTITGVTFMPPHSVVFEEATGTWCGFCPRGTVYMDSIAHAYPSTAVVIAVHNGDPMADATYDAGMGPLVSGYPAILVNRHIEDDPSNVFARYNLHINEFGFAELGMTITYNQATRVASIDASAKLATNLNGDYRLALVITENGVKGTSSGYDQVNYYSGGTTPLAGAGHDWVAAPDPVPAADMSYDFVARTIINSFNGQSGSLPSTMVADQTYNHTFTYTVPATSNPGYMKANLLMIDVANNRILNGLSSATLVDATGISIASAPQPAGVFPNPAINSVAVAVNLKSSGNADVAILNVLGETVVSRSQAVQTGMNTLTFDVAGLASGAYFIAIKTADGISTTKFIKN